MLGTALAELVAARIAGMHSDWRDKARAEFIDALDDMITKAEREIFPDGLPAEWRH